jgi:hypothetical protein
VRGTRFGLWGAAVDRYSTLASLFWVAYAALAMRAGSLAWQRQAAGRGRLASALVNPVVAVVLAGSLLVSEVQWAQTPLPVSPAHRECMIAVPQTEQVDCLRSILPGPPDDDFHWNAMRPHLVPAVRRLAELELSVFANP